MQIKSKYLLTMLAVAGISLSARSASAATTFDYGDLLLGFRATGGTGSTSTLIVNIGNATTLRDSSGGSTTLIDISGALTAAYGSDWATRTDLTWGAAGVLTNDTLNAPTNGDPARTLYLTKANTAGTVGVQSSTSFNTGTNTAHQTIANNIFGFEGAFDTYGGATTNGNLAAVMDTSLANSWDEFTSGSSDFTSGQNIEGTVGTATGRVLDLYRILGSTSGADPSGTLRVGSWEGTLSLGTDGVVSFTTAAVPEPSRALFAALGLGALVLRRRRRA